MASTDDTYPPPTPEQTARYRELRAAGKSGLEASLIVRAETRAGKFPGRSAADVPPAT
ncbi:hypothetical protein ABZW11_17310 [Nonomuraea sp. NPDC004580]|uniref:hypothetical protein n=1 Tax=Nonomuraea sp. NPDC004580 TaxID=3154552 RepID=UPI0033AA792D